MSSTSRRIEPGKSITLRLRLTDQPSLAQAMAAEMKGKGPRKESVGAAAAPALVEAAFGSEFERLFAQRIAEADEF